MTKKRSRSPKRNASSYKKGTRIIVKAERSPINSRPSGEERKVHEDIIRRRITGGITLTKEDINAAYMRALKQWHELPGSIVRPPTDIVFPTQKHGKSKSLTSEQTQSETMKENI